MMRQCTCSVPITGCAPYTRNCCTRPPGTYQNRGAKATVQWTGEGHCTLKPVATQQQGRAHRSVTDWIGGMCPAVGCAKHTCGQFRPQIANHVVGHPVLETVELVACLVDLLLSVHECLFHCGLDGKARTLASKNAMLLHDVTLKDFHDFTCLTGAEFTRPFYFSGF